MTNSSDFPDIIPVFPLPGALLLPRSRLPLHIFEPRYLAMIEDVLKTPHRLIGMIQPRGKKASDRMQAIGCAGRVTQFSETEDGRYMVTLSGVSRYRIGAEVDGFTLIAALKPLGRALKVTLQNLKKILDLDGKRFSNCWSVTLKIAVYRRIGKP